MIRLLSYFVAKCSIQAIKVNNCNNEKSIEKVFVRCFRNVADPGGLKEVQINANKAI